MTRLVDVWRAVDPEARRLSGTDDGLARLVRSVVGGRAGAPHLPALDATDLLVIDAEVLAPMPLDELVTALAAAGMMPAGVLISGLGSGFEAAELGLPILASARPSGALIAAAGAYLGGEEAHLRSLAQEIRLAAAEAALTNPEPAGPAAVVAHRIRRGVAVMVDGELRALVPRSAGRAVAARFAAAFSRLLGGTAARPEGTRRLADGLWIHGQRVRPSASVWVFDDLPLARVDETAAAALSLTLRALLARAPATVAPPAPAPMPPPATDRWRSTLLEVARANGRVAPAARKLGVHRNTVLYRLRIARRERGIDPRRPDDALRILREAGSTSA